MHGNSTTTFPPHGPGPGLGACRTSTGGPPARPGIVPLEPPARARRLTATFTRQRPPARRALEPVREPAGRRMAAAGWPSAASLLLAHATELAQGWQAANEQAMQQLSGSCPAGSACDGAAEALHPTIAELRQAVASGFKLVPGPGLGEQRSLDGVIVLIAEADHDRPGAVTQALQSLWRPGDLHFVELPQAYLRSGQMDEHLRGIPVAHDDAEGGSVGMDDLELGLRVEAQMGKVAKGLLDLIDALARQVRPGVPPTPQADIVATLPELRRRRGRLWAEYQGLQPAPDPRQQQRILRLRRHAGQQEAELERLIAGTVDARSDSMAQVILDRVRADRSSGASPRRAYVAVAGAAHLQRMAQRLQRSGRAHVLLCPDELAASIDACR